MSMLRKKAEAASPPAPGRAADIAAKVDGARAVLAALDAELGPLILDAVERKAGAPEKLSAHRGKLEAAKTAVEELKVAQRLAARLEREDAAEQNAQTRADQLTKLRSHMAARG